MNDTNNPSIAKSTKIKIIHIGLLLGFVFAASSGYLAYQYMEKTKDQRLRHMKEVVQIAKNSIEPILVAYRNQDIFIEETLEQVRNTVRKMVYNDHTGRNYIFMSAYDGIMLVQPFEPEKEMTDSWGLKDAYGKYIIRDLVKAAKSPEGQGFVSYYYQRPGEASPQEKISYVIGIPELGCYIGTGQYMADIRKEQITYILKIVGLTFVLLTLLYWIVWASLKEIRIQNAKLHKTERELQAIFDNTFQLIGTLSSDGKVTKTNRSSLEMIGKREADVIGKLFWETSWWTDEETKNRLKKAIHDSSNGEFCRFEVEHRSEKEGTVYVDFNLSPILDDNGKVISLLAEGRDITEQVRIRNNLIKEKKFFNYVIESLPGAFFLYKFEGGQYVLKQWNHQQHKKIFGASRNLKNTPMTNVIDENDLPRLNQVVERVVEKGNATIQLKAKTKNKGSIPILYQVRHFEHDGESFIVGTGIELTEKIKAEEEKEKLEVMLAQSQKMEAMGTLAGGVAHDFNNILSAILGFAELVKMEIPAETQAVEMQDEVIKAALRAKDLVNQILLFSRQTDMEMKPLRPEIVIKEALKLLRSSIPTTIEIIKNIPSELGVILADATQIHQIVMNLCTNAYHAMRETGGTLTVSLTEHKIMQEDFIFSDISLDPGDYLLLEIKDTGHGMDLATLDKIFDPYFTTKEKGEGTGLGLSVVHGIVKSGHGKIKVKSEPGKGTSVKIYFPKVHKNTQEKSDQSNIILQTGSEHILLVDDDHDILNMMQQSLKNLGYQLSAFSSSQEALGTFSKNPDNFDLIITDMTMPQMTGMELSKEVLNIRPETPIILCTGYNEFATPQKAQAIGIKALLFKPVLREEMSQKIRDVLGSDT